MSADPADVQAIEALQRRYARLNDEGRWQELAELFTEDASLARPSDPEHPIVGRPALLASFLARPARPARHLVANPEVELLGPDDARASCYSILLQAAGEGTGSVSVGGFQDRLKRTPEGWRFAARLGSTEFDPVPFVARPKARSEPRA